MTLDQLVTVINEVDEALIIFQKDKLGIDSEIALFNGDDEESFVITKEGVSYHYLLEVSIAKEIILDLISNLKSKPSDRDIAQRVFDYAINDA